MRRLWAVLGLLCLSAGLIVATTREAPAQSGAPLLRVGMPRTFFHDVPPILIKIATDPFTTVLRNSTGMSGELDIGADGFAIARGLVEHKLQLGVFHSFEFGWAQQQHPELRPLMIAINSQRTVSAYVLVRKDSSLKSFADLKGKAVSLPKRSREPTRLYLEHASKGAKQFFGQVVRSNNVESALDELCQGKVQAAAIDAIGLEFYKDLKPGCFARLRVLAESGPFPPAVIAYCPGGLDRKTVVLLRDCLKNAHATPLGGEMMKMWKITSFDPVPVAYTAAVAACIKRYPSPN